MHAEQLEAPTFGEIVPEGQKEHVMELSPENCPGLHSRQTEDPLVPA